MRKKKLYLNTISSLVQQLITICCGFILPRFMLSSYGSNVNGLVSSITQFLSFISLLQLGVGAVMQSSLYKPLADGDEKKISEIYISASRFFKKIVFIFLVYIVFLCVFYPLKFTNSFDHFYIITLILVISISLIFQYYFGITNQLLLYADQKAYIYLFIQTILIILNTIICIFLIKSNSSIQLVKLLSSIIFAINPIFLSIYVKNKYKINTKLKLTYEPIQQKWNGFAQHLSSVVMENTDVVVLTIFSSLTNVSIYHVYHMVIYGIRQLITAVTVGIQSIFGEMIAKNEIADLKLFFAKTEILFHYTITTLYSCVSILIVPFVLVYTSGVNDANYNSPLFALILSCAFAIYCYRLPYYTLIKAAGYFKETQSSAFIETIINLSLSIIIVIKFGIVGVAVGTLISNLYRILYFITFLKKNILFRDTKYFFKLLLLDCIIFLITHVFSIMFVCSGFTYISWFIYAIKISIMCFTVSTGVYMVFYYKNIKNIVIKKIRKIKNSNG